MLIALKDMCVVISFILSLRLSDDEDQASGMTDKDKAAQGKSIILKCKPVNCPKLTTETNISCQEFKFKVTAKRDYFKYLNPTQHLECSSRSLHPPKNNEKANDCELSDSFW